jgi:hypothetical protein
VKAASVKCKRTAVPRDNVLCLLQHPIGGFRRIPFLPGYRKANLPGCHRKEQKEREVAPHPRQNPGVQEDAEKRESSNSLEDLRGLNLRVTI